MKTELGKSCRVTERTAGTERSWKGTTEMEATERSCKVKTGPVEQERSWQGNGGTHLHLDGHGGAVRQGCAVNLADGRRRKRNLIETAQTAPPACAQLSFQDLLGGERGVGAKGGGFRAQNGGLGPKMGEVLGVVPTQNGEFWTQNGGLGTQNEGG